MIARLQEVYPTFTYQVHNAMFSRQSPGPGPCGQILQRLWLSYPRERVPENILHYRQRPQSYLPICFHPVSQILSKLGMKDCLALSPLASTLLL
jgi:hypothetical protein